MHILLCIIYYIILRPPDRAFKIFPKLRRIIANPRFTPHALLKYNKLLLYCYMRIYNGIWLYNIYYYVHENKSFGVKYTVGANFRGKILDDFVFLFLIIIYIPTYLLTAKIVFLIYL